MLKLCLQVLIMFSGCYRMAPHLVPEMVISQLNIKCRSFDSCDVFSVHVSSDIYVWIFF